MSGLLLLAATTLLPGDAWSNEQELLVSSSNISISSNAAILPVEVAQFDAQTGVRLGALADVYEAFGLRSIRGVVIGPDGDIFVAARLSSGGIDNEAQVLRYDGATLQFESVFVSPNLAGLRAPEDITFGPDGHLYVASNSDDAVLRYDGNTGAFIDVFIPTGAGGLDSPYGIAFGPDGNLYVTSAGTDSVLRYEPLGGNFIGVAAQVSNDGYISPRGVGFGPDGQLFVATITGTTPRFGIIAEYHPTNGSFIREFAVLSQGLNATGEIIGDLGNDADGNLLVGDVVGDMVRRFDPVSAEELDLAAAAIERPRYFAIRNLESMTIDSNLLTITGDGDNDPNAIYGLPFAADVVDGLANFYIPGDVLFDTPTIRGVGDNGIVLHVGNNATIADGVQFDVAARHSLAGPGGGAGGVPGQGGQPGAGGRPGTDNLPIVDRGCTGSAVLGLDHDGASAPGCGGTGDVDVIFAGLDGNPGIPGNTSLGFGDQPLLDGTDGALPGEAGEAGTVGGDGGFGVNNTGLAALGGAPGSAGAAGAAGAAGGGGSSGSGAASSVVINAGDGGAGGGGSPGAPGEEGGQGTIADVGAPGRHPYVASVLSGGNGGGAGGGGGGGGGGGAGGNGGNGGGGGGGGATRVIVFNAVLDGGEGGIGGLGARGAGGTRGGGGSDGAPGGGGGGALEIRAAGRLTVGESRFDASGAPGTFPNSGGNAPSPLAPPSGSSGGSPTDPEVLAANDGGDGGRGGNGGRGGFGGQGGRGGTGGLSGPGAGGMISLQAASIAGDPITVFTNAGARTENSLPAADDGHVVLGSNVAYPTVSTTSNPPITVAGIGDNNPFLSGGDVVSNIMGITGGADVYGMTGLSVSSIPGVGAAPAEAVAAIVRMDVGPSGYDDDYRDQDMILLVNLSDRAIANPELGIGTGFRSPLLQRGFANLPQFGGNGAETLNSLAAGAVFVTLVPDNAVVVNFRGSVDGTNHSIGDASLAKGDATFSAPMQTGGNGGGGNGETSDGGGGGAFGIWSVLSFLVVWMRRRVRLPFRTRNGLR